MRDLYVIYNFDFGKFKIKTNHFHLIYIIRIYQKLYKTSQVC